MAMFSMTRRRFVQGAMGATGLLAVGGVLAATERSSSAGKPGGATTRYPLRRLAVVAPGPLTAAPGPFDTGGGKIASGLLYNGALPGPVFGASTGDAVSIPFTNGLSEPTTVHWHGLVVPQAVDGQPQDPIPPGGEFTYAFTVRQRAGFNWFHPHPDMATSSEVALGLAGGFLIRDAEEAALPLPSGLYEVALVLRDANFDRTGNLSYNGTASGFTGKTLLVNGTRDPYLAADPAVYRFRILGGSNSRLFRLAMSTGEPFTLIGNDGGLLPSTANVSEILLSPGERVDVLVDLRNRPGQTVSLRDLNSGWTLLELRVANATPVAGSLPTGALSTIDPLGAPATTRTFSFDGMTRINGQLFDMERIDFQVPVGTVEDWVFTTNGNAPHPVHVHGASFQVVSRSGGRNQLYDWEGGWKDTVLLNDGETVRIRIRFELQGRYLIHCHKLEHEDAGMMTNFEVV